MRISDWSSDVCSSDHLFFNAVSPRGPITDTFLDATIKDYVRQCYPVARVSAAYGVDDDRLFRTATDLPAAFAAMAGPATFSTIYTRSEEHTSELQSLMRISYAVFCLKKKTSPTQ